MKSFCYWNENKLKSLENLEMEKASEVFSDLFAALCACRERPKHLAKWNISFSKSNRLMIESLIWKLAVAVALESRTN